MTIAVSGGCGGGYGGNTTPVGNANAYGGQGGGGGGGCVSNGLHGPDRISFSYWGHQQQDWYLSEREHLRRVVKAMLTAGIEIHFSIEQRDSLGYIFYAVSARAAHGRSESVLGTCTISERVELVKIIDEARASASPTPEIKPKMPVPVASRSSEQLWLVDKEIADLQADWALMTDDGRVAKLAAIRQRLQGR